MLKHVIFASGLAFMSLTGISQTATVTCVGSIGSYQSGSVTSSGSVTDDTIKVTGNTATRAATIGWAVFDLSTVSIPAGSVITGGSISFNITGVTGQGLNASVWADIYGNAGDLCSLALNNQGNTLYNNLTSGTIISKSGWPKSTGVINATISGAGANFLAGNLSGPVTVAFRLPAGNRKYTISGYDISVSPPQLTITYAPACSGAPNPGNFGCNSGNEGKIDSLVLVGENSTGFYDYGTGCGGTNAYDDRTSQAPVDLMQGGSYTAMINSGFSNNGFGGSNYAAVWIDVNSNNSFSNNERITATTTALSTSAPGVPINIPASTAPGIYKMRMMVGNTLENGTYFLPCNENLNWHSGEVHDYMINVIANPLAITIGTISVQNDGKMNILRWNTLTEDRADAFEIERSSDARNFELIGRLDARGSASSYTFRDEHAVEGMNYYRLKMKGSSAEKKYSRTVSAVVSAEGSVMKVHPNPVSNMLNINMNSAPAENARIMLFDMTGKLILQEAIISPEIKIDVNHLPNGVYFIKYLDAHTTRSTMMHKN